MDAGELTKRCAFMQPVEAVNADGQIVQSWVNVLTAWCKLAHLRGGESVMQSRLASRSPAIVTFRNIGVAALVTSEWRVIVDGKTYEAKEDPRETQDRAMLEMLVEAMP